MALATRISNLSARAMCDAIVDRIDLGSGTASGHIKIYSGTQAADPDTAIGAQVLLAELPCSNPAFGAAADANPGGRATASAITSDSSADNTGTATWFRVVDRDGVAVMDGSVGTSGADMNLDSVSIVAGVTVAITSWTVTQPES